MTVTSFNTLGGNGRRRRTKDKGVIREYTVKYRVISDSVNDGPQTILEDPSTPIIGQVYSYGNEFDLYALVGDRTVAFERDDPDTGRIWILTITYTTDRDKQDSNDENYDNPLAQPTKWTGGWANYQRATMNDIHGTAYANSNGEPFDPPKMVDDPRNVLRAVKNYATPNIQQWSDYRAKLNSDNVWGLAPRQAKVQNITWKQVRYGGGDYYEVTFDFEINLEAPIDGGWDERVPDRGFEYDDAGSQKRFKSPLDTGTPSPEPAFLDGTGGLINGTGRLNQGQNPTYWPNVGSEFEWYQDRPFLALGLPGTIGGV